LDAIKPKGLTYPQLCTNVLKLLPKYKYVYRALWSSSMIWHRMVLNLTTTTNICLSYRFVLWVFLALWLN